MTKEVLQRLFRSADKHYWPEDTLVDEIILTLQERSLVRFLNNLRRLQMKAVICDRCKIQVDETQNTDIIIENIEINKGSSYSDKLANLDLCSNCMEKLWGFLVNA